MRILIPVCLVALLAGCSDRESRPLPSTQEKRAARIAKAEAAMAITPFPKVYRFDSGELRVMAVPVKDSLGYVEAQRCFIWRDAEYRTSSISCPAEQQDTAILAPSSSSTYSPSEFNP